MPRYRVLLIDDHRSIREIAPIIETVFPEVYPGKAVEIAAVSSAADAKALLKESDQWDLIISDLSLDGGESGIEFIEEYLANTPVKRRIKTSIISATVSAQTVMRAFNAGVVGYIPKDFDIEGVCKAIHEMINLNRYIAPSMQTLILEGETPEVKLTQKEEEVFRRLVQNMSTADIAEELGIKESTVKGHMGRVSKKYNLKSITSTLMEWISKTESINDVAE